MKKLLIMVVACLLLITGCNLKKEETIKENENGNVIVYKRYSNYGAEEEMSNYYYITVTSDKKITWGKIKSDIKSKELTDKEYQEIIDMAFTQSFKDIGTDISDESVLDGYSSYITLYYNDGEEFKTGGLNPNNTKYNNHVKKLNSYTN